MAKRKSKAESPKLVPQAQYVLKHRDKQTFVAKLTPVEETARLDRAYTFTGQWLNDCCWSFEIFYTPITINAARMTYERAHNTDEKPTAKKAAQIRAKSGALPNTQAGKRQRGSTDKRSRRSH